MKYIDKDFVIKHLEFLKSENVELTYDMLINEFIELCPTKQRSMEEIEFIAWLYIQIEQLQNTQDNYKLGMLKAFEMCLKKYNDEMEESEKTQIKH